MKCLIFTLSLTGFSLTFCGAQSFANQKMLTTTFSQFNFRYYGSQAFVGSAPSIDNYANSFSIRPQISYGKVNSENELFAYGIDLGFRYSDNFGGNGNGTKTTGFHAYPMMIVQKFLRLSDYFYLSPGAIIKTGYNHIHTRSTTGLNTTRYHAFHSSATFIPVSLTYVFNPKTNVTFSLGHLTSSFIYGTNRYSSMSFNSVINTFDFSFNGSVRTVRVGVQILIQK